MSLSEDLERVARRQRVYASLREGGTKRQKELSVLQDLLEAMTREGEPKYSAPRVAEKDPPDCVAITSAGELAAFEVTEFVSQTAVELNERARPARGERPAIERMVMAQRSAPALLDHVAELLLRKDKRQYLGGPYAECVALIYTDEPLLVRAQLDAWLNGHVFGPYRRLTGAYFLFNYEPNFGYPYRRLTLGGA